MIANKMKSRFIYTILFVFASFAFVFTGCTNGLTQKLDKKNDSSKIVVEGIIKLPSAIPSAVRSAYTSYTDYYNSTENQTSQVIMEITATATINETNQEERAPIQNNTFTLYLPKEDADWTFEVKCCDGATNQIIMSNSTSKTIHASESYISLEPFVLTYTPDTIGIGQINLPFKATDSSITKLKFELKDGDVEIFTGQYREFYNSLAYLDIGRDIPVSQGTYDLYISFVDADGMIYGPVVETISVITNFTTDTWFGSDSFIKQTTGEYNIPITAFVVPSATQLKAMFPNYTYGQAVTGDVALMWDYDPDTYKPTYTVHPVDSGFVSDVGYPLALGKDIRDVFPDYSNNDMYVLTNENAIYKYTASSGYSEYKVNYETDFYILSACANGGVAYALCFDGEAKYMSPETQFILYKFDNTNNYMTEIGYVPFTYADFPDDTDTFKMATCDNYIFIAYNYGNDEGFCCDVFNPNKMEGNNLLNCWSNGEYDHYYNSITEFKNKVFRLNDIIAIHNDIGSMKPDLYVLLGCTNIRKGMMPGMSDSGYSYGGIIKIQTTMPADNIYNYALDTDYGYRYLYKSLENASLYCNDSPTNFYNPIRFVGMNNNNHIIADDGAIIQGEQGKNGFTITNAQNVNRILTVNITAPSEIEDSENPGTYITAPIPGLIAEDVIVSFDNNVEGSSCYNYKMLAANSQQMSSGSMFSEISGNSPNIVLANGVTVNLYFESNPTNILPSKRGEPLYFITTPAIPNATYQAVLYCNGKDLNKDSDGNPLYADERYYIIDSQAGTLTLNKPLPLIGCEYQLEIDVINNITVDGKTTTIHNDVTKEVYPATEFEIRFPRSLQAFYDLLDNLLIADYATVIAVNNPYIVDDYEGFGYALGEYYVSDFVNDIVSHFNAHPCDCLTLDFSDSDMTGLTEITSGMFAIDCSGLKLPDISGMSIKEGAFYNDSIIFKGDLKLSYNVSVESGAFAIPPRSIVLYGDSQSPNIYLAKVNSTDATETLLIRMPNWTTKGVITCTKRDEPFEIDLTGYNYLEDIHANAFRGLPVTNVNIGNNVSIGDNAFKDTPVEGTL